MAEKSGWWGKVLHRLTAADDELEAEDLRRAAAAEGAAPIVGCQDHQEACVAGTIRSVTLRTRSGAPSLEVEIYDGSGSATLVFLGRRQIPGLDAGRSLKASGRISRDERRTTIFNPRYELLPASSAGV
ncbi:OB-fold nucleic acid binding domain-containing protein [Frankia sp. CNm7]|uniref:OB-fold nucleic acid binding domain-containing protein n=1 Tax=Frankia nepalensis TaxID=1836974 RepID=A0A937UNH5_9ACTN|nr:OB-fold nucleic acid binding domain-containing protein [Frankia nepalensis]MBL7495172.1 OB-fold nucleic acid binding domain-containing protein [Frankia nepalensis]MBL7514208.1 OB-fold nucleic acid binding domain-containing protein [Frankia nepalensis]MBL7520014.1 OB-fold nucleic acid binding domain-containing protein [Frankia nepalensis]MBL7629879.1 OB-fold nucleic acid binding domain-containing protein [Frankia nepalensis]